MKWFGFFVILIVTVECDDDEQTSTEYVGFTTQNVTTLMPTQKPFFDYSTFFCEKVIRNLVRDSACGRQLEFVCKRQDVLLQMLDATGKYSGILYGSKYDWGNFDQCINLHYHYQHGQLLGKYCPYLITIPDPQTGLSVVENTIRLAACIPNGCRLSIFAADETEQKALEDLDGFCATKESGKELSTGNIVVIVLFSVWIIIILICTGYDIGLYVLEKGCHHPNLINFSLFSNFKKLVTVNKNSGNHIEVLDGLRVISIAWVIAGHGFSAWFDSIPATNGDGVYVLVNTLYSSYINGAHFAVDTFFFMSGLLMAFNYVKGKPKPVITQIVSVPVLYLHRYIRLTASLGTVYLFTLWIFPKLGSGPIWVPATKTEFNTCTKYWWTVFLYIQNYYNYDTLCIIPTWYLSADMQMFILCPIVLIPLSVLLKTERRLGMSMVFLLVLNVLLTVMPMVISYRIPEYNNAFDTHSRLIDYSLGITMGIIMQKSKTLKYLFFIDKKHVKLVSSIIWSVILSGMFVSVLLFQPADVSTNQHFRILYSGLSKPVWCIGLCWIVYSCHYGYGGPVNWILTTNLMKILSRVTYTMYLLHFMAIAHYVLSNRSRLYFSDYQEFHMFCGYFIETLLISLLWTLFFEYPILSIEKMLLRRKRNEDGK